MGTNLSQNEHAFKLQFDKSNYEKIGRLQNYKIWREKQTLKQIQEYQIFVSNLQDIEKQKQTHKFRQGKDNIVTSLYLKCKQRSMMCTSFYELSLFIERFPLRLNEISDLIYPHSLHLIHSCLKGFCELFKHFGSFKITQRCIGINLDGTVKVWISEDFGKNIVQKRTQNEHSIVNRILQIVFSRIDKRSEPENLHEYLLTSDQLTFSNTLTKLYLYVNKYKVQIPNFLISIVRMKEQGLIKKMSPKRTKSLSNINQKQINLNSQMILANQKIPLSISTPTKQVISRQLSIQSVRSKTPTFSNRCGTNNIPLTYFYKEGKQTDNFQNHLKRPLSEILNCQQKQIKSCSKNSSIPYKRNLSPLRSAVTRPSITRYPTPSPVSVQKNIKFNNQYFVNRNIIKLKNINNPEEASLSRILNQCRKSSNQQLNYKNKIYCNPMYLPNPDGGTNPQLLKLTKFIKHQQKNPLFNSSIINKLHNSIPQQQKPSLFISPKPSISNKQLSRVIIGIDQYTIKQSKQSKHEVNMSTNVGQNKAVQFTSSIQRIDIKASLKQ